MDADIVHRVDRVAGLQDAVGIKAFERALDARAVLDAAHEAVLKTDAKCGAGRGGEAFPREACEAFTLFSSKRVTLQELEELIEVWACGGESG